MDTLINKKVEKSDDVSIKTLITYSMGSLGNNMIYALISSYLLIFLTDSFKVGAAAIGTLFLVARIIDAITDPIMGVIVLILKSERVDPIYLSFLFSWE